jgi:uncharacterized protein YjbI with pentapeptide repeats/beta-lactamase regulating signal transducer with metallopeptidase domain
MIEGLIDVALAAIFASVAFGALLFALVTLVVRIRSLDATSRHVLWTVALCTTALLPLVVLSAGVARSHYGPSVVSAGAPAAAHGSDVAVPRPDGVARESASPRGERRSGRLGAWQPQLGRGAALAVASLWLAGALAGLAGLVHGVARVRGLKRRSSPLDARLAAELPWLTENHGREREIYLRLSYEIETPVAVGFRRPVILIPTELAAQGGLAAIEGLVMHEHAHLRRRDDWTNLAGRVVERVFWFNPLVWLFGRRIALERELAADDAVVAATGRPHEYARSLWQLAREMRMPEHSVVAPGALSTRKAIALRIEALLERRRVSGRWRVLATFFVALTAIGCTVAAAANAPNVPLPAALQLTLPVPASVASRPATAPLLAHAQANRAAVRVAPLAAALPELAIPRALPALAVPRGLPAPLASLVVADCTGCEHRTGTFAGAVPDGSDLSGADLRGVDWRGRTLRNVDLSAANLTRARLDRAQFIGCNLGGADLSGASLTDAVMTGTDISAASFKNARTRGLRLVGVSLAGMDLRGLDVRSLVGACTGCDIQGADLRAADLRGVHISGVNFSGSNLRGADLTGATLVGVNFEGADLRSADLLDASFTGCSFDGAELRGARAGGATFLPTRPAEIEK